MMMISKPNIRVDVADQRAWCDGKIVAIPNKQFALLAYFLANPERLLTQSAILRHVWPKTNVSNASVKDCVRKLRKALRDDAASPRFIETVRGSGYRYLGGIEICNRTAGGDAISEKPIGAQPAPLGLANNNKPRIAVLPWQQIGVDEKLNCLGRGFSAELIHLLAKNKNFSVIAKASSFSAANEADQLGFAHKALKADYAIEGEVIPDDYGVRVIVNTVDTATHSVLASECHAISDKHLSSFEFELAPHIAARLTSSRGPIIQDIATKARSRLPSDLTAFELYVLATESHDPHTLPDMQKARDYLERAIAIDPFHAQSWLLLSYVFEYLESYASVEDAPDYAQRQLRAIDRACELDPRDGRIMIENADRLYKKGDMDGAAAGYIQAHCQNTGVADVQTLIAKYLAGANCNEKEARRALASARDLNPMGENLLSLNELRTLYLLGDYESAIKKGGECLSTPLATVFVALSYLEMGQFETAQSLVRAEHDMNSEFEPMRFDDPIYIQAPHLRRRYKNGIRQLSSILT